jgi:hypothetical protein
MKELVRRVRVLEEQVAACLQNQPLLFQVFDKCNRLERRLKEMKKQGKNPPKNGGVKGKLIKSGSGNPNSAF